MSKQQAPTTPPNRSLVFTSPNSEIGRAASTNFGTPTPRSRYITQPKMTNEVIETESKLWYFMSYYKFLPKGVKYVEEKFEREMKILGFTSADATVAYSTKTDCFRIVCSNWEGSYKKYLVFHKIAQQLIKDELGDADEEEELTSSLIQRKAQFVKQADALNTSVDETYPESVRYYTHRRIWHCNDSNGLLAAIIPEDVITKIKAVTHVVLVVELNEQCIFIGGHEEALVDLAVHKLDNVRKYCFKLSAVIRTVPYHVLYAETDNDFRATTTPFGHFKKIATTTLFDCFKVVPQIEDTTYQWIKAKYSARYCGYVVYSNSFKLVLPARPRAAIDADVRLHPSTLWSKYEYPEWGSPLPNQQKLQSDPNIEIKKRPEMDVDDSKDTRIKNWAESLQSVKLEGPQPVTENDGYGDIEQIELRRAPPAFRQVNVRERLGSVRVGESSTDLAPSYTARAQAPGPSARSIAQPSFIPAAGRGSTTNMDSSRGVASRSLPSQNEVNEKLRVLPTPKPHEGSFSTTKSRAVPASAQTPSGRTTTMAGTVTPAPMPATSSTPPGRPALRPGSMSSPVTLMDADDMPSDINFEPLTPVKISESNEVASRVFHNTMSQSAPKGQSGGRGRGGSGGRGAGRGGGKWGGRGGRNNIQQVIRNLPRPDPPPSQPPAPPLPDPTLEFSGQIKQDLKTIVDCMRNWDGGCTLEARIGRILIPNVHKQYVAETSGTRQVVPAELCVAIGGKNISTFTPVITTLPAEIAYLVEHVDENGKRIWCADLAKTPGPTWKVTYEIIGVNYAEGHRVTVEVDAETFDMEVAIAPIKFGEINVHALKQNWDVRIVAEGKNLENEKYAWLVEDLKKYTYIEPKQKELKFDFQYSADHEVDIKSVRAYRRCSYPSTDGLSILHATEVHRLTLEQYQVSSGEISLNVVRGRPAEGVPGYEKMWYELSVTSKLIDDAFKVNKHLEIGDEATWTVEEFEQAEGFEAMYRPALMMVKKMDGIGFYNDNGLTFDDDQEGTTRTSEFSTKGSGNITRGEPGFW